MKKSFATTGTVYKKIGQMAPRPTLTKAKWKNTNGEATSIILNALHDCVVRAKKVENFNETNKTDGLRFFELD